MNEVVWIGGVPSSRTTHIVELLAAREVFLCFPETGLALTGEKNIINRRAKLCAALGLDARQARKLLLLSAPPHQLLMSFVSSPYYLVIEKTPENIFSNAACRHGMLVVTRKSEEVVTSLFNRGFTLEVAFQIWLACSARIVHLLKHQADFNIRLIQSEPQMDVDKVIRALMQIINGLPEYEQEPRDPLEELDSETLAFFRRQAFSRLKEKWTKEPGLVRNGADVVYSARDIFGSRFNNLLQKYQVSFDDETGYSAADIDEILNGEGGGDASLSRALQCGTCPPPPSLKAIAPASPYVKKLLAGEPFTVGV